MGNTLQSRPPSCPACGQPMGKATGTRFQRCSPCGHWFARLDACALAQLESIYHEGYDGFRPDTYFQQRIRQEVVEQIVPRIGPPAQLLDVGCGNGDFLTAAQDAGYVVHGVDISAAAVARCRGRGLSAWQADFLGFGEPDSYDVITMWDVIEHLPEPREFVQQSFRLLRPGGWLVIKTPRSGDLAVRLSSLAARAANILVQYPSHIQFFGRESLQKLVGGEGFDRLDWLPCRPMRSPAPIRGWKKAAARVGQKAVNLVSGSGNLYLMARKPAAAGAVRVA